MAVEMNERTGPPRLRLGFAFRVQVIVAILALAVVLSIMSPHFLTSRNLMNILLHASVNAIMAYGMTFVVATGGIDLSMGTILGFSGVILAKTLLLGVHPLLAIGFSVVMGALVGLVNGYFVSYVSIVPFIVTLGSQSLFRGITFVISNGKPIFGMPQAFVNLAAGSYLGVPTPVFFSLLACLLCHVLLKQTKFGQYALAIGSNEEAARVCGVNVRKIKALVYVVAGSLAALAGTIVTGRLRAAEPIAGTSYELEAVAAVVLGGTSLSGGKGSIVGSLLGAILISVLRNGLNILGVQAYYQQMAIGIVLVGAVVLDQLKKQKR